MSRRCPNCDEDTQKCKCITLFGEPSNSMANRKEKPKKVEKKIGKKALINALNVMDEFACEATRDNDNGEAQQLERAYNKLANFLNAL